MPSTPGAASSPVDAQRHVAVPAGPFARSPGRRSRPAPPPRRAGRAGRRPVHHGQMQETVDEAERLVVGDMLLRLRRHQVGQREPGGLLWHGVTSELQGDVRGRAAAHRGGDLRDADPERVAGPERRAEVRDLVRLPVDGEGAVALSVRITAPPRRGCRPRRPPPPRAWAPRPPPSCRPRARASAGPRRASGRRARARAGRAARHGRG